MLWLLHLRISPPTTLRHLIAMELALVLKVVLGLSGQAMGAIGLGTPRVKFSPGEGKGPRVSRLGGWNSSLPKRPPTLAA